MHAKAVLFLSILLAIAVLPASAEPPAPSVLDDSGERDELNSLETLAVLGKVLRVRFFSEHIPGAEFGPAKVQRWSPEVRLRARFPIAKLAVGQIRGRFRSDRYTTTGDPVFGAYSGPGGAPRKFYQAAIQLAAARDVDFMPKLFSDHEIWSIFAAARWRARWEPGAFSQSMTGGGGVGIGYALSDRLRVVLGIGFESHLGRGGVRVGPLATLHWRVTDRWKIRTRQLGAQIEYAILQPLSIFVTSYRQTSRYALDSTTPEGTLLVFRDRPVMLGSGFKWQITKTLRLAVEGGAVLGRELRLRAGDEIAVDSGTADPHGYFELRLTAGR